MTKKKVGIVTIIDYQNFGNRLQNYALQESIKLLDFDVSTFSNISSLQFYKSNAVPFSINSLLSFKFYFKKFRNFFIKMSTFFLNYKKKIREKRFLLFTENFIHQFANFSKFEIFNLDSYFDFFVVGSDQIWNPIYRHGNPFDFLAFAKNKKKIAYSPSFGISSIPELFVDFYSKSLSSFHKLSVREFDGSKIILKLTGRKAEVLLDPTFLLKEKDWNLIKKPHIHKPSSIYILTYFLGKKDFRVNNFINKININNLYKIVDLGDLSNSKYFNTDPSEFLDFINSASLILTDSYHGTIFSLIYRKPFVIFDRLDNGPKINSRFETLDALFQLNHRFINKVDYNHIFNFNFPLFDSKISLLRKKSIDFLYNSLK